MLHHYLSREKGLHCFSCIDQTFQSARVDGSYKRVLYMWRIKNIVSSYKRDVKVCFKRWSCRLLFTAKIPAVCGSSTSILRFLCSIEIGPCLDSQMVQFSTSTRRVTSSIPRRTKVCMFACPARCLRLCDLNVCEHATQV